MVSIFMGNVLKELHELNMIIQELQQENKVLEEQVKDLRARLDKTYEFIHHTGNSEYAGKQDWDGVTGTVTTGTDSKLMDHLTKNFGIDEYPLE